MSYSFNNTNFNHNEDDGGGDYYDEEGDDPYFDEVEDYGGGGYGDGGGAGGRQPEQYADRSGSSGRPPPRSRSSSRKPPPPAVRQSTAASAGNRRASSRQPSNENGPAAARSSTNRQSGAAAAGARASTSGPKSSAKQSSDEEYYNGFKGGSKEDGHGGFAFLLEPDIKGFSGLHKLINGIPYDCEGHRGWDAVRKYITFRDEEETLKDELEEYQVKTTPMLMACCRKPPIDIVERFVEVSPSTLTQTHGRYYGMLPLHFACKFFASKDVISLLVAMQPGSIVSKDKGDRTPVHCMLSNFESTLPPADVLRILIRSEGEDGEIYSPVAIKNKANATPLQYLILSLNSIDPSDPDDAPARRNAADCVDMYCSQIPCDADAMAMFAELAPTAPWLLHRVLRQRPVQRKLDELMAQSFNSEVLVADLAFYIAAVAVYFIQVMASLEARRAARAVRNTTDAEVGDVRTYILYVCSGYLLIRQMVKIYRLMKLKLLVRYVSWWSVIDLSNAALLLASSIHIHLGTGSDERVQVLYITTGFTVFLMLALFLGRGVSYRFSVFLGGIVDILSALIPFFAFMGMAVASFGLGYAIDAYDSAICIIDDSVEQVDLSRLGLSFCSLRESILKVYSMYVTGTIDEDDFVGRKSTMAISILFGLVALILLLAALVATSTRALMRTDADRKLFFYTHRYHLLNELEQVYQVRPAKIRSKRTKLDDRDSLRETFWSMLCLSWSDPTKIFARNKRKKLNEKWEELNGWKWVHPCFLGDPEEREKVPMWRRFLCLFMLILWVPFGIATFTKLYPFSVRQWFLGTDEHRVVEDDILDDIRRDATQYKSKGLIS